MGHSSKLCCCGPTGSRYRSITAATNAGSATLSAYFNYSLTNTCYIDIDLTTANHLAILTAEPRRASASRRLLLLLLQCNAMRRAG